MGPRDPVAVAVGSDVAVKVAVKGLPVGSTVPPWVAIGVCEALPETETV